MNSRPPDHRDTLLHDTYSDASTSDLPARMAARIRRQHRLRKNATAALCLIVAAFAFWFSRPHSPASIPPDASAPIAGASPQATPSKLPDDVLATDADLMAALDHESVIIFTLADGQRQVVWLNGRPRS